MSGTSSAEQVQVVAQPAEESGHDKTLDVSAERVNSEAQTEHDPLCPASSSSAWADVSECGPCDYIAKVRADEREKAWMRVLKLCGHTKYVGCEPCFHDECAEAARGEES